ncbi:UNVERIFIED_CONTAM: 40S ribosomal protein S30 [Sesamum latifolium]|uniref:40S ribosomal protein S30 n=1 Tax=Sesamum latifolium TaxID=2727402 RepID=A0AAW2YEN7_9LAMI
MDLKVIPFIYIALMLVLIGLQGKVHGSLARAGKVRGQTPKVAKQDKKKKPRGRAHKRMQYNRRFVTAVVGFGKKRGPNSSEK